MEALCRCLAFPQTPLPNSPLSLVSQVAPFSSAPQLGGEMPKLPVQCPERRPGPASPNCRVLVPGFIDFSEPSHPIAVIFSFSGLFWFSFGLFFPKTMSMTCLIGALVLFHLPLWMKAEVVRLDSAEAAGRPSPHPPWPGRGAGSGGSEGLTLPAISPFSCPHPRIRCRVVSKVSCFLPMSPHEEPHFPVCPCIVVF